MMTVTFCSAGTRGRPQHPHVTLSQSTSTMRARLVEAGVEFTLPLAPREEDERVRQQVSVRGRPHLA